MHRALDCMSLCAHKASEVIEKPHGWLWLYVNNNGVLSRLLASCGMCVVYIGIIL